MMYTKIITKNIALVEYHLDTLKVYFLFSWLMKMSSSIIIASDVK